METEKSFDFLSEETAADRGGNLGVAGEIGLAVVIAWGAVAPAGSRVAKTLCAIQSWYDEQLDEDRVDRILSEGIRSSTTWFRLFSQPLEISHTQGEIPTFPPIRP